MRCNICGSDEFAPFNNRPAAACKSCGSLERTRLFWMVLDGLDIRPSHRILHIAPERCVYSRLSDRLPAKNYDCADIDTQRYGWAPQIRFIDLTKLEDEPSGRYDFIFHIHVLEHIPCTYAYTLYHLHRMLAVSGLHVCVIPFLSGGFDECYQDLSSEERTRRFGQFDHIRRFGANDVDRHLGKVLRLPDQIDFEGRFGSEALRQAAIPENLWKGYTTATVLELSKDDYRLA